MWFPPAATAARSPRSASPRSRGGPKTPSPASCIAPYPARRTRHRPSAKDPPSSRPFPVTPPPAGTAASGPAPGPASAPITRSGAVGGHDRTADRRGGVAHEVDDDVGDRLRGDRVHQHLRRADLGGDPVDDAAGRGRVGRIGRLGPDAVRQLLQRLLAPVDPDHCEPGGRQLLRGRTAELTARAGHDRHTLAHAATSAETAPKTDDMAFLLPVMNGPDRSGRVQVHRREGERSSSDSGDLPAIYRVTPDRMPGGDGTMTGMVASEVARRVRPGIG